MDDFDLAGDLQRHARDTYVDGATADWVDTAAHRIRELEERLHERDLAVA